MIQVEYQLEKSVQQLQKKLLKSLKYPSLPYPKAKEEFIEEIHKLEPIERVK